MQQNASIRHVGHDEVRRQLSALEELEKKAALSEADIRAFRTLLGSADTSTQVAWIAQVCQAIETTLDRFNKIQLLVDERRFLQSLEDCVPPREHSTANSDTASRDQHLRENLVHICEAVVSWRRMLSVPLPVVIDGRQILFDFLKECHADVREQHLGRTAPSFTESGVTGRLIAARRTAGDPAGSAITTLLSRPYDTATAGGARSKHSSAPLLAISGYFPYSLGDLDEHPVDSRTATTQYQRALHYLRGEHQRQITWCRNVFDVVVRQGKYLPLMEAVVRLFGDSLPPLLSHLQEQECQRARDRFRAVLHMFSRRDREKLFLVYDANKKRTINARAVLGTPPPPYVVALSHSSFSAEDQLRMTVALSHARACFTRWAKFVDHARNRRVADMLRVQNERQHLKLRLVCWYRFRTATLGGVLMSLKVVTSLRKRRQSTKSSASSVRLESTSADAVDNAADTDFVALPPWIGPSSVTGGVAVVAVGGDRSYHSEVGLESTIITSDSAPTASVGTQLGAKKVKLLVRRGL